MKASFSSLYNVSEQELNLINEKAELQAAPSKLKVVWNEFKSDKLALISLFLILFILVFAFIASFFINTEKTMETNILASFNKPFTSDFWLGADTGGRSIAKQLIIGSKNSILIAIGITVLSSTFGIGYGLISGYFGGFVDLVMQRFYDFMMIIPMLMFIIVLVTIIPHYNAITLTLILSCFFWMGTSRLIRSRSKSESQRDYVSAAKTSGSSNFRIIFNEIMPNISSLIIVDLTLSFAENIGVETGLSYLGFGLPLNTPSLGTLIANANDPTNITNYWWTWLPAALEIVILCLAISYVDQALRRATNVMQRKG